MKKLLLLTLTFGMLCAFEPPPRAQEQPAQQPTAEEAEKEKVEREKNAYRLLDQVIDEAQSLRLTENRVRVQINAADMLWDKNQGRSRQLFSMAAEGVAELGRAPLPTNNRRGDSNTQERRTFQLRQELVLAAARHDAQLAYQLLASTKPSTQPATQNFDSARFVRPMPAMNTEESLEQTLLGRIAALDPNLAAQNAEQMMDKGQFPRTVAEVIDQLYKQDPEAGAKLADKTVKRLQGSNILINNEAANLAQVLLSGGIRQPSANSATSSNGVTMAINAPFRGRAALEQSTYVDLLSTVVDAALKVTMPAQNNQRTAAPRARTPGAAATPAARPAQNNPPTEAQIEQTNARRLFAGISVLLPTIEQYLPSKAAMVRQKLTEAGVSPASLPQTANAFVDNNMTVDSLVQLASTVPTQMQPRIYQQAAYKAIEEGNIDRARQIATDFVPANLRDGILRRAEARELTLKDNTRFDDIRQNLARLQTDNEKIDFLLQLANDAKKTKPKLAAQLLDEARQMTNRRATSYEHFEQQLKVARAFVSVDPARAFEVLDPGIGQLNELLSAAAILNGFEINMFRDGELTMQGGSGLTSTINRYGQELAILARADLERSEILAGRFQMTEPRIMARMAIVQGLLRTIPGQGGPNSNPMRQSVNVARP